MSERNVVLDTSAVVAFLSDEAGADLVEGYLVEAGNGRCTVRLSFATMAEVFSTAIRKESRERAEFYIASIRSWRIVWVQSSDELCLSAGALKARYKMSFADAFIVATALHSNGVLVHKDPEFLAVKSILPMKILPYKSRRTGTTGS